MAPAVATYAPRDPSGTVLYHMIAEHLETFLASCHDDPDARGLPAYVQREFYDYLERVAERKLDVSVSVFNPRSTKCPSWVEKPLFFPVCLEV